MNRLFAKEPAPANPASPQEDDVSVAKESVDRLAAALATADRESVDARNNFDREMRQFVAGTRKTEPTQEPQRDAIAKVESLRRLLAEARERLMRATTEAEDARRLDAIRASGTLVAELTARATQKIEQFQTAVMALRVAESELFKALFDSNIGLKQRVGDAQRDADFARGRLRRQAIKIAQQGRCLIDARFEVDGEVHAGPIERSFYAGR